MSYLESYSGRNLAHKQISHWQGHPRITDHRDRYLLDLCAFLQRSTCRTLNRPSHITDDQRNNSGAPALRQPYLRVLGIELDTSLSSSPGSKAFTPEEEEEFQQLARSDGLYERFAASVAPSIYGNMDIKKAVVCLLMGGSKKILPDGGRLRGDINVLMLGDPGTAKSQLLKFVEKVCSMTCFRLARLTWARLPRFPFTPPVKDLPLRV